MPTSRLDIDLSAIERNLGVVRAITGTEAAGAGGAGGNGGGGGGGGRARVSICAVVKQDGYGLGAARIAKRLVGSGGGGTGGDVLAVYALDEARALAEAVPNVPILVFAPVYGIDRTDPIYRHVAAGRLHLTLHNNDQLTALMEAAARIGSAIPVHVQADTGLSRGGSMPETARALVEKVVSSSRMKLAGLMTHFASPCCDDQFTREQAKLFREFVQGVAPAIKHAVETGGRAVGCGGGGRGEPVALHAANSCASFRSRSYHGTMVRVGQALLGYGAADVPDDQPFEFRQQFRSLESVVRWTTGVVHVEEIPAGWAVGYGSTWRSPHRADGRKTRIALLPVGYADGYPRSLGGEGGVSAARAWVGFTGGLFDRRGEAEGTRPGGPAYPGGKAGLATVYAPVVGRVSMDQITVDVTDVPESYLRCVRSGNEMVMAEAEVYGRQPGTPNFLPALAQAAGTITHEMLCRVGPRVERVYRASVERTGEVRVEARGVLGAA